MENAQNEFMNNSFIKMKQIDCRDDLAISTSNLILSQNLCTCGWHMLYGAERYIIYSQFDPILTISHILLVYVYMYILH